VTVYDHTRREAEYAVREAAPTTLGVNRNNLRCGTPLPSDEQPDDSVDPGHTFDDSHDHDHDGSASSDSSDAASTDTHDHSDDHGESACNAPIKPIWEADEQLSDDDWVDDAIYADQLRRAYEDWESQGDYDNPPPSPIVDAFS
jgi:hypothetical protein